MCIRTSHIGNCSCFIFQFFPRLFMFLLFLFPFCQQPFLLFFLLFLNSIKPLNSFLLDTINFLLFFQLIFDGWIRFSLFNVVWFGSIVKSFSQHLFFIINEGPDPQMAEFDLSGKSILQSCQLLNIIVSQNYWNSFGLQKLNGFS